MSDRDDLFVRGGNGTVIGIALEGHPDAAPDAEGFNTMIPLVPIPESATIGPLPDVVTQANDLANANARIAQLEAALSAASSPAAPTPEQIAAERIRELEAQLAGQTSSSVPVPPAVPPAPAPVPSPSLESEPVVPAPAPGPSWTELATGGADAAPDPTA